MNKDKDFQERVKDLQRKIDRDEKETYSKKVIKEYRNPVNFGFIENPDATGKVKGPCNETIRVDLKVKKNVIQNARFWTDGCGASIACGNMLISMIKGKNIEELDSISNEQLLDALDGLPKEHQHCAKLAVNTLREVIKDYLEKKERK